MAAVASTASGGGLKVFTADEVAKHNTFGDLWLIVDNKVYDVSKFANVHPGGKHILLDVPNNDATEYFYAFHATDVFFDRMSFMMMMHIKFPPIVFKTPRNFIFQHDQCSSRSAPSLWFFLF